MAVAFVATGMVPVLAQAQATETLTLTGTIRDFTGVHAIAPVQQVGSTGGLSTHPDFDQFDFGPLVNLQNTIAAGGTPGLADILAVISSDVPPEYLPRFIDNVPAVPPFFPGGTVDLQNPPLPLSPINAQNQTKVVEEGIVGNNLGGDGNPVYLGADVAPLHKSTHGAARFDEWFNDTAGVNLSRPIDLNFTVGAGGTLRFEASRASDVQDGDNDGGFFPIDNELAGNDGVGSDGTPHNFSFTLELHETFTYQAGQTFHFMGDDDLFLFIDGKLALDLGGLHNAIEGTVDLDTLNLVAGEDYAFDLFYAERNQFNSDLLIETSIAFSDGVTPPPPPPAVPLPAAVWMGLTTLAGMGVTKRLRARAEM